MPGEAGRLRPRPFCRFPAPAVVESSRRCPGAAVAEFPPFTIRESSKAKRVILKVSPHRGLEVVIPRGFNRAKLSAIIEDKRAWLDRAFQAAQLRQGAPGQPRELPAEVFLPAIGQRFTVEYVPTAAATLELSHLSASRLRLTGAVDDLPACQDLLKRWMQHQGRRHLSPWLARLSAETGLKYQRVQIRGQRSRWGSYSARGTISLNYNLLFQRPPVVRYLLLHELCHTIHLNHSVQFYRLLAVWEPGFQELRRELRGAWLRLPWWAQ